MPALFVYTLLASLTLALLYTVYWFFLRRTSFHQLNRYILLGIAAASLLLPLAARFIPDPVQFVPIGHITAHGYLNITRPEHPLTPSSKPLIPTLPKPDSIITPADIFIAVYLPGVLFFILRTL